ncbi:MAG: hypothetical protein ACXWAT_00570 [Methylobacter sp.]
MAISDILDTQQSGALPLVRFERVAEEDKAASVAAGHYVARDVDYALVTPPYSKDVMKNRLPAWLDQLAIDANAGRVPNEWVSKVKQAYEFFKNGQEIPLDGIPIKGWGIISPAQQETLIRLNILTVESLAGANHEGLNRIGMGALELKNKAEAWLKSLKKSGGVAIENAELKKKVEAQDATIALLEEKLNELNKLVESKVRLASNERSQSAEIDVNDLIGA